MSKSYELRYGWKYDNTDFIYSEYEVFSTKEQRDQYLFNLLHGKGFTILWYKKIDTITWYKNENS